MKISKPFSTQRTKSFKSMEILNQGYLGEILYNIQECILIDLFHFIQNRSNKAVDAENRATSCEVVRQTWNICLNKDSRSLSVLPIPITNSQSKHFSIGFLLEISIHHFETKRYNSLLIIIVMFKGKRKSPDIDKTLI